MTLCFKGGLILKIHASKQHLGMVYKNLGHYRYTTQERNLLNFNQLTAKKKLLWSKFNNRNRLVIVINHSKRFRR